MGAGSFGVVFSEAISPWRESLEALEEGLSAEQCELEEEAVGCEGSEGVPLADSSPDGPPGPGPREPPLPHGALTAPSAKSGTGPAC